MQQEREGTPEQPTTPADDATPPKRALLLQDVPQPAHVKPWEKPELELGESPKRIDIRERLELGERKFREGKDGVVGKDGMGGEPLEVQFEPSARRVLFVEPAPARAEVQRGNEEM